MPLPEYFTLRARINTLVALRNSWNAALRRPVLEVLGEPTDPGAFAAQLVTVADVTGLRGAKIEASSESELAGILGSPRDPAPVTLIISGIDEINEIIQKDLGRLAVLDEAQAMKDFPGEFGVDLLNDLEKVLGRGSGGGFQPAPFQFDVGPGGQIVVFNPNTGQTSLGGTFPGLASDTEVAQDPRTGDLIAFSPSTGERKTIVEGFGFPEISPQAEFALRQSELALSELSVLGNLDLAQRGLEIQALTQDFAHQIELERMTYEEARQRLDTINAALTQRRAEREQLLQFAVTERSLRAGGTETLLPGGEQLAAILSQATGQEFGPDFAQIPAGRIDPEAAGQDVVRAGSFQSPIPGLTAGLEASREAISAIIGAPLAGELTTQTATNAIVEGI